jgi:hypothetical protein
MGMTRASGAPTSEAPAPAAVERLYRAGSTPELVDVPELLFLMVDGQGDPNVSPRFQEAVQALYGVSYTLKFELKRTAGANYKVSPLEGLWWVNDTDEFSMENKAAWQWTAMIRQPFEVTAAMASRAAAEVAARKGLPAALDIRLEPLREGLCVQVLHVGPYATEPATVERLDAFIQEQGYRQRSKLKHHEIYLGDPRRTAPERLRTIIRHPVERS